jgi:TrmH family RNA methyltransferase
MGDPVRPEPVTSRRNPLLRRLARLDSDPAQRRREGVFLAWGRRLIEEALQEPGRVERLVVAEKSARGAPLRPLLRAAREASIPVVPVTESILNGIFPGAGDQGILAVARIRETEPEDLFSGRGDPLLLIADRIQDPGNLGALVRLAEAAAVCGLAVLPGTVDPYHTRAVRASAGSILRVPIHRAPSAPELIGLCRRHDVRIAVTLPDGGTPCDRADLRGALALVLGNEGEGVSRAWSEAADLRVTVPLGGVVQSLNVTLAAAALLYEARRQRGG